MLQNRDAAARYAKQYARGTNPAYGRASGNDCTNFVSQALIAGGWTMVSRTKDDGDRKQDAVWWYGKRTGLYLGLNSSWTWANADSFSRFLAAGGRATKVDTPAGLVLGDVIQLANANRVHHTMIVTEAGTDGLKVSYHSTDELNIKLEEVRRRVPNDTFLYWKLKG